MTTKKSLIELAKESGNLVEEKNKAYGSSFEESAKIIEILFPDGIKAENYKDLLLMVRIIDKLFRISNRKDAFDEDPWKDIAGYGLLGVFKDQKKD